MIDKIMNASLEMFDSSEIYHTATDDSMVVYGNGELKAISSNRISGVMMRVVKAGKLGIASATTLEDPGELLKRAADSARHGEKVPYSFSAAKKFPDVDVYSPQVGQYTTEKVIQMCEQAKKDVLAELPDISVNIKVEKETKHIQVATSQSTRAEQKSTGFTFIVSAPIKGAGTSIYKYKIEKKPFEYPADVVEEFVKFYRWTENTKTPKTAKMPVIWSPQAMDMFGLSLCAGLSGEEFVKKTSPVMDKVDKQIMSDKITLLEDPHSPRVGARGFDDEGVPTERRALVEKGVLKSVLLDLRTGAMLGARSSGNGFKKALFGGGVNMMPNPWPGNLWFEPGPSSLEEMIASLDRGILLTSGMGFHSGNYSQGNISVQAIGYLIEKGKVTGRLDSTMLSTNIYADFMDIRAISKEMQPADLGYYPYVLVDSMQVVGK